MKHYKKIINIPDLPDYSSFSTKIDFDLADSSYDQLRKQLRLWAIDRLPVSEEDKKNAVLDVRLTAFSRYKILDQSVTEKIAQELGLAKPQARVQVLYPGQYTMLHLDDLDQGYISPLETWDGPPEFTDEERQKFREDPRYAVRFFVMLEDSKPGQLITFGDEILDRWKKGDVIYWDWPTVVHSTINSGFWPRPLIRLTGLVTEKTKRLISQAS